MTVPLISVLFLVWGQNDLLFLSWISLIIRAMVGCFDQPGRNGNNKLAHAHFLNDPHSFPLPRLWAHSRTCCMVLMVGCSLVIHQLGLVQCISLFLIFGLGLAFCLRLLQSGILLFQAYGSGQLSIRHPSAWVLGEICYPDSALFTAITGVLTFFWVTS